MFSRVSFVDRGMVADVTVHHAGSKNPHAHILLTTREIGPDGFGKKNRDWNRKELLQEWRAEWSRHANKALERAGREERIDHRTLEAQRAEALRKGNAEKVIALDREPVVSMDRSSLRQESEGRRTKLGERRRQALSRNASRARFWKSLAGVNYAGLTANPFVKTVLDFQRWLFGSGQQGVEKRRAVAMERAAEKGQERVVRREPAEAANEPPPVTRERSPGERQAQGRAAKESTTVEPAGVEGEPVVPERVAKTPTLGDRVRAAARARQEHRAEKVLQERECQKERARGRDSGMEM